MLLKKLKNLLAKKYILVKMENEIKKYLKQYDFIIFALIFGSYVTGDHKDKSDLDIGIYSKECIDLLQLGKIITDMEKISNRKIDLIELKDLYKKSPLFAYNVIIDYKLLFAKDKNEFIKFKRNIFLEYFDTEKLRKSVHSTFHKRISSAKFGKRNYA